MGRNFQEFRSEFHHGEYDKPLSEKRNQYHTAIRNARSEEDRALLATEYAEVAAFTILECYDKWLNEG